MKDVGFTEKGNRIVEMTREEYNAFVRLCASVEKKGIMECVARYPDDYTFKSGYDFSKTFEVIRAFYDTNFRINDLRLQIDSIQESLNK